MFRGYLKWDPRTETWNEDEWLCKVCMTEEAARGYLEDFADGRPYDNNREAQVTRYFEKRSNPFVRGRELQKGDPGAWEKDWMRYNAYPVEEIREE